MIYQTKGIEYLRIKSSNFYNYFLNKLNKRKNFNLLLGHSINSVKSLDNEVIIDIGRKEVKSKMKAILDEITPRIDEAKITGSSNTIHKLIFFKNFDRGFLIYYRVY